MNVPSSRKRSRLPTHADINDAMYEWYSFTRERSIPVTGPMLQEEALQVASRLGNTTFKASNGWLEAFKKRHNIKQLVVVVTFMAGEVALYFEGLLSRGYMESR